MPAAPLIWFADDWGRHPSSSQHLARHLLPRRRIHWINTIGTRKPRLSLTTLSRSLEKLRDWSSTTTELSSNLTLSNPRMWPWFTHGWDRWLNRVLLTRHVRRLITTPPIIVTTLPLTADLVGRVPAARWVYYCVDDFTAWPGLDGRTLLAMKRMLVAKVDRIIAASGALQERIKAMGRASELLTHGVNLEFWAPVRFAASLGERGLEDSFAVARGETGPEEPRIVFWGVIDRRMDVDVVRALSGIGKVVLVGPRNDPDPELLALRGVELLSAQPLEALPGLARQAAVLIMPYADLAVTRAMQPLKLKEYLAVGKPCVVRDLPACREWADCLDLADSPESFVAAVKRRLEEGLPESQRLARQRLTHESWDEKARQFERMIDD
jgi:glycosyltransferase involved in cell wall biosynthesis